MFIWGYHIIFNFCWIFLIDIQCLVDSVFLSQHLKYVTPLPSTCKNSSMKLAINFSEYPLNMMNSFSFTALKIFSLAFAILATKELDVDIFEFMFLGINFIGYIDYTVIKYEQFQSLCFQIFLLPISLLSFCYYYLGIYYYTWWHARDLLISVHFSSFLLTGETIQLAFQFTDSLFYLLSLLLNSLKNFEFQLLNFSTPEFLFVLYWFPFIFILFIESFFSKSSLGFFLIVSSCIWA